MNTFKQHIQEQNTADIILKQLGGSGKLKSMIGAKDFMNSKGDLIFKFPVSNKINSIKIHLNNKDLYDIEFGKIVPKNASYTVITKLTDVNVSELKSSIEKNIKKDLSL